MQSKKTTPGQMFSAILKDQTWALGTGVGMIEVGAQATEVELFGSNGTIDRPPRAPSGHSGYLAVWGARSKHRGWFDSHDALSSECDSRPIGTQEHMDLVQETYPGYELPTSIKDYKSFRAYKVIVNVLLAGAPESGTGVTVERPRELTSQSSDPHVATSHQAASPGSLASESMESDTLSPDEVDQPPSGKTYPEGATTTIVVNAYERNRGAREACITAFGHTCSVCQFDFTARYGRLGTGYIHVHHLVDLSTVGDDYKVDPINDLRPVCPNCHAMLHKKRPAMNLDDLRARLVK